MIRRAKLLVETYHGSRVVLVTKLDVWTLECPLRGTRGLRCEREVCQFHLASMSSSIGYWQDFYGKRNKALDNFGH